MDERSRPSPKFSFLEYAHEQIDQLSNPSKYATFGTSTNSRNIINSIAQQNHLLEKQLLNFTFDPSLLKGIFSEYQSTKKMLDKSATMFLLEPLNPEYKLNLVAAFKQDLTCCTKLCEILYNTHIDKTLKTIDKVKLRFEQLSEISRWKKDDDFHQKVTQVADQSIDLIHNIYDIIRFTHNERISDMLKHLYFFSCSILQLKYISYYKGGHGERIKAIETCISQLELERNSIHRINLYKLNTTISIYSNINSIKTKIGAKNLNSSDISLLNAKFELLEACLLTLEPNYVDMKSNYDDLKELLQHCQYAVENRNFDFEELEMTVETLELFLTKLKVEVNAYTTNILKSTLHQYNTLMSDARQSKNNDLLLNHLKDLFSNLSKIAGMMSLLATEEDQARELLFSCEKIEFVSTQILSIVEHWFTLNCVKDCSFYHCMIDFLNPLWHQMYYRYLSDLHLTIEFDGYFAVLEDIYFSAAKEAIRSISTGNAELFQAKSTSVIALLDYMLCYVRDKSVSGENNEHSQVIINKIKCFRNKFVRKLYQAIHSVHHFIVTNPNVMLPESFLAKFERLCSNIQSELHDFSSLYNIHNLMHKINSPLGKLATKVLSDSLKLFVEQVYDKKTGSDVISSKIAINNTTCSIEYDPCVCFVVVNEFGNSVLDVKTFHIEDNEIITFLKSLTPNTLLVVSITNPTNIKIPDQLINYFTLIDSQILTKFQKNSSTGSDINFDGAILVGYVSKHRYIHWYQEQMSFIGATKNSHLYNDNVPTPLTYFGMVKIDIRQHDSSSSTSLNLFPYRSAPSTNNQVSIVINGVEYVKGTNNVFSDGGNSCAGYGYCYVFENLQNPHHGNLIQIKVADIEEFVSGLTMGSVCCFVFPHGIGENVESAERLFGLSASELQCSDNLAAIYVNRASKIKEDNFRYVKEISSTPIHMTHYINTKQSQGNMDSTLFLDNTPNANLVCSTSPQNNIHKLMKKVNKQDGEKINKLNKEFDLLQNDFLSQLRKVSLLGIDDSPLQSDDDSLNTSLNNENSVLALAKKISFLVSHIVDITRNDDGPMLSDQDIINNCREIKRLGECMRTACNNIANQCQKGPTKTEITNLTDGLPLFLQQLLVLSRVNYGSVYYSQQNSETDATQMASSLIVSSINILKAVVNLLKLTHSAKVQYKLNIDIKTSTKFRTPNIQNFMSVVKDLQDSIYKPSTL